MNHLERYWARPAAEVLAALDSRSDGLTEPAAASRLKQFGRNTLTGPAARSWLK